MDKIEGDSSKGRTNGSGDGVVFDVADITDIPELVRLRIQYMIADHGSITDENSKV